MKMIQISDYVKLVYQMPLNKVVKIKIGSCKMHKLATKDCARIQLRSGICENFAHGRGYLRPGHGDGGGDAAAGIFTREEPRRAPAFYTEPGLQRSRVRSGHNGQDGRRRGEDTEEIRQDCGNLTQGTGRKSVSSWPHLHA